MALACAILVAAVAMDTLADEKKVARQIRELPSNVLDGERGDQARALLRDHLREGLQEANDASRANWLKVSTRNDWQAFRKERMTALHNFLGEWPESPQEVRVLTAKTSTHTGDGFTVHNIAYESRPGWWVTANLYVPAKPTVGMPGIIISHSHHRPKEQGELQDMGMTWARAGCVVLVPDHLGHGERGQHGFRSSSDFPREFQVSRQDYYFRYDNSIQLYLVGDSLMGWMAWDLMRGVDVLLQQKGVDPAKIILLGAVAGGGDPCAVTAALDERIACAVPFNFGGPQPETRYPLPEDSETSFNYAGSGGWESTRNLAFSAGEQSRFLPWEIVAGIAPRRLIFGHEFSWDRERDPVWKRLEKVYELNDARDRLAYTHGRGELKGRPPQATHCTNIGEPHRVKIHEAFAKCFDIKAEEFSQQMDSADLAAGGVFKKEGGDNTPLCKLLAAEAKSSLAAARKEMAGMTADERRRHLQKSLAGLLGDVAAPKGIKTRSDDDGKVANASGFHTKRIVVESPHSEIPMLLLLPDKEADKPLPVVIGLAQSGKAAFLKHRADEIAKLLAAGVAVCLPDVSNVGETSSDHSRGRYSTATARAATSLMLGEPLIAQQLRDVRAVVHSLRTGEYVKPAQLALWGESFAELNAADTNFRVPRRIDDRPHDVEPLGGMLALLTALYEDDIAAVTIHRGLASFESVLDSPFVYMPLDSVIPGLLQHADVSDIAAALSPRPVQLAGMVDGYNRLLSKDADDVGSAAWLIEQFNIKEKK